MARAYSLTEQALADAVAKLDSIRSDTIEECARHIEFAFSALNIPKIAASIRALKDKP